jgi:hypothetical protein
LEQTIYAPNCTTIALCLSLFLWAAFRKRKGAVKLHKLLDLRGCVFIPRDKPCLRELNKENHLKPALRMSRC